MFVVLGCAGTFLGIYQLIRPPSRRFRIIQLCLPLISTIFGLWFVLPVFTHSYKLILSGVTPLNVEVGEGSVRTGIMWILSMLSIAIPAFLGVVGLMRNARCFSQDRPSSAPFAVDRAYRWEAGEPL